MEETVLCFFGMKRRGATIIAILLMLVVLASVIGAMAIAGGGTLNGQFVSTRAEEARRAAEAGAQAALGHLQAGTVPPPAWLYGPTATAPVPWQKMNHLDTEFQVLHIDHSTPPPNAVWISPGRPAQDILPTISPTVVAGSIASVPAAPNLHYLYSTGRTRSRHYRTVGVLYTTVPSLKILSHQIF